jgi:NAD(P)-dependent dehydrogenase (short-subunit alcohol dehydrogenase family)
MRLDPTRFEGRVAVVTGAGRGIGLACATRFLDEGASVVLADIDADLLRSAAATLGRPERVHTVTADVRSKAQVDALVDETADVFGGIDVMVNNAGIAMVQDFLDISEDDYDAVLAVNLKGPFLGVQAAARRMIAQGRGGVIVNMSSINSRLSNPRVATYAISKGGLNQLTGTAAVALAPYGIRVCGVGPGTIATEMITGPFIRNDDEHRMVLSRTPAGRFGTPAEVAAVVAFLASDDATYMTGQTVYPDGGRLVLNYTVPVAESQDVAQAEPA